MSAEIQDTVQPLPHALGVEKSVLSVIFQFPEKIGECPQLTPDFFHVPAHKTIFTNAAETLRNGDELELVSFVQRLLAKGLLDRVGGPSALADIQTHQPNPESFRQLVVTLDEYKLRRDMFNAGDILKSAAFESGDRDELAEAIKSAKLETTATGSNAFPITRAGLTAGAAAAQDFVEGLLTEGGASVIYGPSNCGKSFWILDLAVCVATGAEFRDELQTDQGAVVYVALEGSFGVLNRIEALKRAGRITDSTPLFLCFAPVSLLEAGHAAKLAASIKQAAEESNLPCRLVILDTLARAMAGGDENAGQDMTAAVASIDAVRAITGAHVAVVHHCGKDEARGARGHSSLRAAVDTEIEVSRPDGEPISTVRVTKQRDMPMGEPMPFSLKVIELGIDRRGKPITSCVVHHEDAMMATSKGKAGRPPAATNDELLDLLPAVSTAAWQKSASEELGVSKSSFHRALKHLQGHGAVKGTGGNWMRS